MKDLIMVILKVCTWLMLLSNTSATSDNNTNYLFDTSINKTVIQNETNLEFIHWQDYCVLVTMLVTSCLIGIYYGYFEGKQITGDDFLLGGSTISTVPMALSLTASFITAIELLGNPAEMYIAGAQFWMICSAFLLVVPITSQFYLPVFMKLRLTSCYEYLELRFCKSVRMYASALYFIQIIFYTAVCVYAPALALSDVTGLNLYFAVSLVYVVCIFYGAIGGIKAVIMTDTFQSLVLIASLVTALAISASQVGGLGVVWEYAWKTDRLRIFDMSPDPTVRHSFWSVVIGGTLYWISMFCANQASIQKYLSVQRIEQVNVALWISSFGLIIIYTINFITGAILALYYADCDPIQAGVINASDGILPLYIVRELSHIHGIPGLFVAGIFAASLGTVASELNSLAALVCQDLITGLFEIKIPKHKEVLLASWVSVLCGIISFGLVFVVQKLGPVLQLALSFNGMAGGIGLGLFTLGMFFPWANSKGAIFGGMFGLLVVLIAGAGSELTHFPVQRLLASIDGCVDRYNVTAFPIVDRDYIENHDEAVFWLFRISYLWYTGIGSVATIAAGLLVSVFTGFTNPATVPVDLLSPPIAQLLHLFRSSPKKSEYIRLE